VRVWAATALILLGCGLRQGEPQGPAPRPPPPVSAVAAACTHLRVLGCPDGEPTADGVVCEVVIPAAMSAGMVRFDLACIAHVQACKDVEGCALWPD
jgi:hypothetical protein